MAVCCPRLSSNLLFYQLLVLMAMLQVVWLPFIITTDSPMNHISQMNPISVKRHLDSYGRAFQRRFPRSAKQIGYEQFNQNRDQPSKKGKVNVALLKIKDMDFNNKLNKKPPSLYGDTSSAIGDMFKNILFYAGVPVVIFYIAKSNVKSMFSNLFINNSNMAMDHLLDSNSQEAWPQLFQIFYKISDFIYTDAWKLFFTQLQNIFNITKETMEELLNYAFHTSTTTTPINSWNEKNKQVKTDQEGFQLITEVIRYSGPTIIQSNEVRFFAEKYILLMVLFLTSVCIGAIGFFRWLNTRQPKKRRLAKQFRK